MAKKPDYTPFTGTYQPFLQTERFDIFHHRVVRNPKVGLPKEMFTAWYRDDDIPRPVCEVILWPNPYGVYVEWVHVCQEHRRQGIATEVLAALENKLGPFDGLSGATDAGEKFVEAYENRLQKASKKKTTASNKKSKKKKVTNVTRKRN